MTMLASIFTVTRIFQGGPKLRNYFDENIFAFICAQISRTFSTQAHFYIRWKLDCLGLTFHNNLHSATKLANQRIRSISDGLLNRNFTSKFFSIKGLQFQYTYLNRSTLNIVDFRSELKQK